jgi:transcriptional regulator with XRE-family HTH domain
MTTRPVAFGSRLRHHREQRGISLRSVADTTKIAHPLLQALERGDVSQWPQGIYRAGFIRAYAAAVGLPPGETALEFAQAFDELEPSRELSPAAPEAPASSLRLTLASITSGTSASQRTRVAALDVCVVTAAGLLVSAAGGFTPSLAIACCALVYYGGSTIWQGRTPIAAWLDADGVASAPPGVQRSSTAHRQPVELALTLAADDGRDHVHATSERRNGTDRRRRSARQDPPRHGDGVGRRATTPGRPSVH